MAKRTQRISDEERERREYARLAREERLGERYSSQSKTRRREVVEARTRQAQNLGPAPVTDEKAAERNMERDKSRYSREGARRYQAERANRPGGPADTSVQYAGPSSTRRESRPLSTMTSGGPGGSTLSREGAIKSLERDVWRAYVDAGYKLTAQVDDGLKKLDELRGAKGQTLRELRVAQGLQPTKDADLLRDQALNFVIGPYLASRLPGGEPTKQDFDPLWDSIDVLGVLPFGRLGKTAALGVRGLTAARAGSNVIDAVRDASVAYDAGKRFPDLYPATRTLTARVTDPATRETLEKSIDVAAPRSVLGRTVVAGFDKTREAVSKVPGFPDFQARRVFREIAERERSTSILERAPARALQKTSNPKRPWLRLTSAQQYALKLVAEGPTVEDHLLLRTQLRDRAVAAFDAAKAIGDGEAMKAARLDAMVQEIHLAGIRDAAKFVVEDGTGGLRLADNAPAQVRRAWELIEQGGQRREDIVRTLDEAVKGTVEGRFAGRIQNPGRVVKGARWKTPDAAAKDASGIRAQLAQEKRWLAGRRKQALAKATTPAEKTRVRNFYKQELATLNAKYGKQIGDALSRADSIVGQETYAGGKTFIPSVRGFPGTVRDRVNIYWNVRTGANRKAAIGAGPTMSAGRNLRKAFKGDSVLTGLVRTDTANLSAESLIAASRLSAFKRMRDELLQIATTVPTHPDDIPIRIDLTKTTDPRMRAAAEVMDTLENATDESLAWITEADTKGVLDTMFPQAFDDVDNIRYVSREAVDATGMLEVRDAAMKATSAWKKLGRTIGGLPVDALNDINKAIVLYLNPAYSPVQFLGNSVMATMQQGVFYPANIAKAFRLHWTMNDTARAALDDLIGVSATNAAAEHGTIKQLTGGLADFHSMLADLGPRRAAWLHEARREGYRTTKQVEELLTNYRGREDVINRITQRGKDAMGNFDKMTQFEKRVVTRIFWFYPWTRAAVRWSALATLEHPYQIAALGAGYSKQQQMADEQIGERPWYMHFAVPVGKDEQGRPIVVNPTQLFPQTSAIEVPALIYGFATGQNPKAWPNPVERLTPALGAAYEALKENDASLLLGDTTDRFTPLNIYKRLSRSDEQVREDDKNKAQPRSETGEILRSVFGSGQVPAPVNVDVVNRMAGVKKAAADKADTRLEKLADETGKKLPEWYVEAEQKREQVNETAEMVRTRMEEDLDRDLTDVEKNQARVEALAEAVYGADSPQVEKMVRIARTPGAARNLIRTLEAQLGFTRASGYKRVISR